MSDAAIATVLPAQAAPATTQPASGLSLWSHGSFSFKDLLDIVNPLQHLPVIGSVYRYLTGDEPSGGARIVGDALYGGPIGFGVGVVSTLLTDAQGHDLGERALAAIFGPSSAESTAVAKADPQAQMIATRTPARPPQLATTAVAPSPVGSPATDLPPADPTRLAARLYRSPLAPSTSPGAATPTVPDLTARFRRQNTTVEGTDGRVLNNRPVPLELSGNLVPPNRLALTPPPASSPSAWGAKGATDGAGSTPNPIAQKMLDALDKYERLKRQQIQEDSLKAAPASSLDLAL